MAKNTKQIGLLQQRFGKLNELPKQLVKAQFGFADDKNRLFIGNPEHPTLKERYESNTFPYGNVEILTEFSDLTNLIKYSPWMNGRKIHYPITILGSNVVGKVPVGSSFFVNNQEIEFTNEGVVVTDYDYLVLRYIWTDGRDLDTETFITNANNIESINNKHIGWYTSVREHEGNSVPRNTSITNSVMYWSGDNTGPATPEHPQEENILISKINLDKEEYYSSLPEIINIELQGTWFNTVGHNPVRMEIYAYKGGVMTNDGYRYVNEGGEKLYFIDEYGDTVDHLYIEVENLSEQLQEYRTLGYININKQSGSTSISVVQNDTSNNTSSNTRKEISLDLAVKQINDSKVNIEAKNVNGHIQLKTTEEELVLENGKTVDGYPTVLEIFGFDGIHELAISPTKRTLQEVLDDRYSVKSFDVLGDGVTNDGYYINIAMEILYDYIKSDPKELYFPADKYIVNDTSLVLYKNTHLVGEGIDRTIIKTTENQNPLLVIADGFNRKTDFSTDDEEIVYPENILIEEMTFDISKSSSQTILLMKTSSNVTFRNCKFICNTNSNIVKCLQNNDILKNIKFENCIFEGNNSVKDAINISCELNGMLITNSEFNNFKNSVLSFNGVSNDKLIENIIIANNKFSNCSKDTHYLVYANEYTRYISLVKSLVDQDVLMEEDGYKVFNTLSDLNYCDTPIYSTDPNKFLRFHFYQSIYDYVQALYNKFGKTAFEVISPETDVDITNYIKLIQGNDDNENILSINATSQTGDVEINMGKFGDLHLGKDSNNIDEWKENHKYNALELVYYENYLYRCIETHISSGNFLTDSSKWKLVENNELDEWLENYNYEVNDIVVFNDDVYVCIITHTSTKEFDNSKWNKIGSIDADIVLHKDLDLNGNAIESRDGSDIVFKTNNNILMIDDSQSNTLYEDRIADKDSAIPTVKYLNDTVNSCVRKKFDAQTINEQVSKEESSEIELVNFKSESFGNDVYLKNVSVNVRQLFIPVNEQIRGLYPNVCKYLDWTNKIMLNKPNYYDIDDVVEVYNPNDGAFNYYKCIVSHEAIINQTTEYNNFMTEFNLGYWEEISGVKYYEEYSSIAFDYVTWYKGDVVKLLRKTTDEIKFYLCLEDHEASILFDDEESFDNDITKGYWQEIILDVSDIEYAIDVSDYHYANDNRYLHLTDYIGGSAYVRLPELLETIKTLPDLRYVSIVSIDNLNRETNKWLFDLNDVNLIYRNTNGYTYPLWQPNTTYQYGDIVRYNYSNFKCIAVNENDQPISHISGESRIDLHNSEVWKKLNEPGFDYQFNFERSLYEKEDGKLVEEDYQFTHNFADHTLKLGLYDENGNNLVVLNKDNEGLFIIKNWQPNIVYYTHDYIQYNNKIYVAQNIFSSGEVFTEDFLKEIKSINWLSYTEYFKNQYIKNGNDIYEVLEDFNSSNDINNDVKDKYLKLIPNHYVQLGTTGEMLVTVNYAKGN